MPKIRADSIGAHKEQTRAAIFGAAEQLFASQGFLSTSLGEIADVAGMGRSTFYEYFPDKDELLVALIEDRVPARLEHLIENLPETKTVGERLLIFVKVLLGFAAREPQLALIVMRAGRKLPDAQQGRMWAALGPAEREIGRLVETGIDAAEFLPADHALTSHLVVDIVIDGIDMLLRVPDPLKIAPAVAQIITDWIRRGLGIR